MEKQILKEICYQDGRTKKYLTIYEDSSAKLEYINLNYDKGVILHFPAVSRFDVEHFHMLLSNYIQEEIRIYLEKKNNYLIEE